MSQIRTAKLADINAFPASSFVIDGIPPIAECQETEIAGATGITTALGFTLTEVGFFAGINLAGKTLSISSPPGNIGDYVVASNTDDVLTLETSTPDASTVNVYTVHDPAQVYLTRDEESFLRYIQENSAAHTNVNGRVYTDLADPPMNAACSDTWNPS
ncbi:hypothetical protein LCGC14_1103420 [marine sediment metagenome]|uniref:Uncharacterized protein n=1 Tax=marine sediment metagenome TaxID=412755 RepID=A0A0F9M8U8_9ZZZZ